MFRLKVQNVALMVWLSLSIATLSSARKLNCNRLVFKYVYDTGVAPIETKTCQTTCDALFPDLMWRNLGNLGSSAMSNSSLANAIKTLDTACLGASGICVKWEPAMMERDAEPCKCNIYLGAMRVRNHGKVPTVYDEFDDVVKSVTCKIDEFRTQFEEHFRWYTGQNVSLDATRTPKKAVHCRHLSGCDCSNFVALSSPNGYFCTLDNW
ncbi:hypothetical protein BCR37DRAFT_217659 [Protomyces lactucae-debilis]|uniref:Extracellular membrane protein CFEM domain-containing protein n=1 Tax=Protomyces lactucae-debilis TaxID=2754530 RepID=A0A1Y2FSZ6_PROLT|nr:uncharacterized protein BCR37DRAFT_217659 [Protomyces lactucae-debilis]ORY86306.1 hypothetical protein BCR37DRAFT_217659 [Protomyces lactucae-debilis]